MMLFLQGSSMSDHTPETTLKKDEQFQLFLADLSEHGNVKRAAETAGVDRTNLYRKRQNEPEFAEEWEKAKALGTEALEDEARRRAYEGWEEPVWHQGEQCGTVRKFSDTLLIFLLKGLKPETYRERQSVELSGQLKTAEIDIYRIPDNGRD